MTRCRAAITLPDAVLAALQHAPCAGFYQILQRRRSVKFRGKSEQQDREQAKRVAWRQLLRWTQAQVALIETGMVDAAQPWTPYALISGRRDRAAARGAGEDREVRGLDPRRLRQNSPDRAGGAGTMTRIGTINMADTSLTYQEIVAFQKQEIAGLEAALAAERQQIAELERELSRQRELTQLNASRWKQEVDKLAEIQKNLSDFTGDNCGIAENIEELFATVADLREALRRIANAKDLAYSANARFEVVEIARKALESRA